MEYERFKIVSFVSGKMSESNAAIVTEGSELKKDKKARPGPPPPSASITTAALIVRGALAGVLGQKVGGTCLPLTVVLSEPGTAKVSISIKGAVREDEIRAGDDAAKLELMKQIEQAANDAIEANIPVSPGIHYPLTFESVGTAPPYQ
jgi:hypothetical protein